MGAEGAVRGGIGAAGGGRMECGGVGGGGWGGVGNYG